MLSATLPRLPRKQYSILVRGTWCSTSLFLFLRSSSVTCPSQQWSHQLCRGIWVSKCSSNSFLDTVSGIGFDLTALLLPELSVGGSPMSWTSTCSCSRSPSPILSPSSLGPHPLSYPLPLQQQAGVLAGTALWLRLLGRRDHPYRLLNKPRGHPLIVLGCLWTLEAKTLPCPSQGFNSKSSLQ